MMNVALKSNNIVEKSPGVSRGRFGHPFQALPGHHAGACLEEIVKIVETTSVQFTREDIDYVLTQFALKSIEAKGLEPRVTFETDGSHVISAWVVFSLPTGSLENKPDIPAVSSSPTNPGC